LGHQLMYGRLLERITTGELDETGWPGFDLPSDLIEGEGFPGIPVCQGVGGIAPAAPEPTSLQANEGAGETRPGSFPLNREENLVDVERSLHAESTSGEPRFPLYGGSGTRRDGS